MARRREYINLLPADSAGARWVPGEGTVLAVLFAAGWAAVFGWQAAQMFRLQGQVDALEAKKAPLAQQLAMVRQQLGITAPEGQMNPERAAVVMGILGERVLWSEVFVQFSRIVPKGLWFDTLEGSATGNAEVRIKGGALGYLAIAEFMMAMEQSRYFEKPQLVYAQKAVVQGQEIVGYEIVAVISRTKGMQ